MRLEHSDTDDTVLLHSESNGRLPERHSLSFCCCHADASNHGEFLNRYIFYRGTFTRRRPALLGGRVLIVTC
jgi:hypothetical protein